MQQRYTTQSTTRINRLVSCGRYTNVDALVTVSQIEQRRSRVFGRQRHMPQECLVQNLVA